MSQYIQLEFLRNIVFVFFLVRVNKDVCKCVYYCVHTFVHLLMFVCVCVTISVYAMLIYGLVCVRYTHTYAYIYTVLLYVLVFARVCVCFDIYVSVHLSVHDHFFQQNPLPPLPPPPPAFTAGNQYSRVQQKKRKLFLSLAFRKKYIYTYHTSTAFSLTVEISLLFLNCGGFLSA